jgi:hypothetical protein
MTVSEKKTLGIRRRFLTSQSAEYWRRASSGLYLPLLREASTRNRHREFSFGSRS